MNRGEEKVGEIGTINNGFRAIIKYGSHETEAGVVQHGEIYLISFRPPTGPRPEDGGEVILQGLDLKTEVIPLLVEKVEPSKLLEKYVVVRARCQSRK